MKKNLLLFIMLCVAHIGFAQLKVNSVGNTGIGASPNSTAKLLLYNSSTAADTIFGLYSTVSRTSSTSNPFYGAYLTQSPSGTSSASSYGIYLENNNNTSYGNAYGFYAKNTKNGYAGDLYGTYVDNIFQTTYGSLYGVYIKNTKGSSAGSGTLYGLQVANVDSSIYSSVYGIHVSSTKIVAAPGNLYGVYASVSGGYNASSRYAGYFTGGKVVIMDGSVGIGKEPTAGLLDVAGSIAINGSVVITSDERLKTKIEPLSEKKDKLYLLQGKSYIKTLPPADSKEDSLRKKEIIEFPEYGYLAQELEKVFPDLVSQDSAGYYAVNYIGLIPVIVEALKDQRSEIEKQQEQIKQLVKLVNIKSINEKAFEENGIESIPLLLQNTPNPFNQMTEIGYYIPETVKSANIYIYDVNGFQQKNISISERGKGATILKASALQAGIYFYTLICDGKPVDTKQMILTR